jgi:hypothetical protein
MKMPPPDLQNSFGRKAAIISFWSSIAGLLAFASLAAVLQLLGGEKPGIMFVAMGVAALIWLNGFAMGMVALLGMKESGRRGVLGRAVTGMVLNGLFLTVVLGGAYFAVHGEKLRQAQKKAAVEADKNVAKHILELRQDYENSQSTMTNPPVLEMSSVQSLEDLKKREEQVRTFIKADQAMQEFWTNASRLYREELARSPTSDEMRIESQNQFEKSAGLNNPVISQMRAADVRWGEAILNKLQFMERHWGDWRYDSGAKKIMFTRQIFVEESQQLSEEIAKARGDVLRLQQESKEWKLSHHH